MSASATSKATKVPEVPGCNNVLDDCLASGIVLIGEKKLITALSPDAENLLGLKAERALNHSFELLPASLAELVREAFTTGKSAYGRQVKLHPEQNDSVMLRVSAAVNHSDGKKISVAIVLNNLCAIRKLEQNMRRLDRLASIGTLSASMAHEIKNALVAVKTFVELLLEKNQDAELVGIVGREMRRIDSIVSQMLKFAGPAKPTFSPLRLHELIDHSLLLVQHQLDDRLIALRKTFNASPDVVIGDGYQLEQAFINLFLNAVEAMGQNGTLTVSTELVATTIQKGDAPRLQVRIQDTGIGVPPENMEQLFEPFFTTKKNGTGLGLSITRRIVQEHRGAITVESEPNKGTAFRILFPVSDTRPPKARHH